MKLLEKLKSDIRALVGGEVTVELYSDTKREYIPLTEYNIHYIKDQFGLQVYVRKTDDFPYRHIAAFKLIQMPGCCGICISTGASTGGDYRNKGIGKLMNQFRIDLAKYTGFTVLICTDVESNVAQRKILKSKGWEDIFQFVNKRTGNTVNITTYNL